MNEKSHTDKQFSVTTLGQFLVRPCTELHCFQHLKCLLQVKTLFSLKKNQLERIKVDIVLPKHIAGKCILDKRRYGVLREFFAFLRGILNPSPPVLCANS